MFLYPPLGGRAHMGKGGGRGGFPPPLRVYPYLITYESLFTVSPPGTSEKTVARPCVGPSQP